MRAEILAVAARRKRGENMEGIVGRNRLRGKAERSRYKRGGMRRRRTGTAQGALDLGGDAVDRDKTSVYPTFHRMRES